MGWMFECELKQIHTSYWGEYWAKWDPGSNGGMYTVIDYEAMKLELFINEGCYLLML